MFWPDTQTGVDVEPARKTVQSAVRKYFTEGGVGVPPTVPGGDWFNQITNEILSVLAEAGINPSKVDDTQLLDAIKLVSNSTSAFEALRRSYAEAGFTLIGSFDVGCTVTEESQIVLLKSTGICYEWTGEIGSGHVVNPGTDPTTNPLWVPVENKTLRDELGNKPLVISWLISNGYPDHSDAYEYALSTGRTVIIDVDLILTRPVIKSENEPVSIRFINGAKVEPPDYAPRLSTNPEHRLTHDSERKFYVLSPDNDRHETIVSFEAIVKNRADENHRNLVCAYFGADSKNSPNARIWAMNSVTNVHKDAVFASEAYGYEVDVNVDTDNTGSYGPVEGLRLAGVGDFSAWPNSFAIHIMRNGSGAYKWNCGVKMREIVDAFQIYYPSRYLMLAYTDKPIKLVPTVQNGNPLFQINNPADTAPVYSVDDRGKGSFVGGLNIGLGTTVSQIRSYRSSGVGFGDIAPGSSATKTFTEIFGSTTHTFTNCDVNLTIDKSGGTPGGLIFTNYTDTATGVHYIRVTNLTSATILNTAFGVRATVLQF